MSRSYCYKSKQIAIANLSNIVKNDIIQSHNRFQEIARDILWLNVTLFNHSELLVTIRQLEYIH